MKRIIAFLLLCSSLTNALPFPFPADPTVAVPVAPSPTPFPFSATRRPGQGFNNNPYYNNYAGGPAVPIVSYSSEHGLDGNYAFSFSTADGKQAQESGYLKDPFVDNEGNPQGTQVVQGSFAYVSPEGTPIQVSYVADENGFRPAGVHIPADGKAAAPILDKDGKQIFDPAYNQYNSPYLNRDRFGRYNNGQRYDPRYPYDPTRTNPYYNNYNPYNRNYNPFSNAPQTSAKEGTKKESA